MHPVPTQACSVPPEMLSADLNIDQSPATSTDASNIAMSPSKPSTTSDCTPLTPSPPRTVSTPTLQTRRSTRISRNRQQPTQRRVPSPSPSEVSEHVESPSRRQPRPTTPRRDLLISSFTQSTPRTRPPRPTTPPRDFLIPSFIHSTPRTRPPAAPGIGSDPLDPLLLEDRFLSLHHLPHSTKPLFTRLTRLFQQLSARLATAYLARPSANALFHILAVPKVLLGPAMIESDYDKVKAMFSNYPNISWPNDHDRQNQPQAMGKDRATSWWKPDDSEPQRDRSTTTQPWPSRPPR